MQFMPAAINMQAYHKVKTLFCYTQKNSVYIQKPAQGDETAIIAAKTLIADECVGIQSYTVS
jgi:hypothetical protein